MLDLRYDPIAREGYVKLRTGRSVRSRPLSAQAQAEYDRHGQLLSISIHDLDQTAAEFLRTSDEDTLLRVIAAQAGAGKAGFRRGGRPPAAPEAGGPAKAAAEAQAEAEAGCADARGEGRERRRRGGRGREEAAPAAAQRGEEGGGERRGAPAGVSRRALQVENC